MAITRAQQVRQMLRDGSKPVVQGGVENYLGKQPQVVVPRKWQSGPDKPPTELAYITEAEKKLLLKEDIHGSLKEGPNEGPGGVMSLDSFGDIGGAGAGGADTDAGGGYDTGSGGGGFTGRGAGEFGTDRKSQKAFDDRVKYEKSQLQKAERKQAERLGYDERENIADYGSADALQRLYMRGVPKSTFPGFISIGLNALNPFRNMTLRKNIDYFRNLEDVESKGYSKTLEGYKQYMSDRLAGKIDAAGNPLNTRDDGGQTLPIIPQTISNMTADAADADADADEKENVGRMFRLLADGGMTEDAPVGGIMDIESGRQMYGLGKLVKKATRAVKKIVKSPVGKAALIGAGFGLAGMGPFKKLAGSSFGLSLKDFLAFGNVDKAFNIGSNAFKFGNFLTTPKGVMTGIAALSAAPLLFGQQQEEDDEEDIDRGPSLDIANIRANPYTFIPRRFAAKGGSMKEPVAKKTMPLIDMDGKEKDYRETGGFVDIGRMERADDVPARLSKNEFVFTADAVRNAGDGSVDKGAEVMYNMMKNLESGGDVSEESQGLDGARKMFQTSKRLEEVL